MPTVKEIREWLWLDENGGDYGMLINPIDEIGGKGKGIWEMTWCPEQKSVCIIRGTLTAIKRIAQGLMRDRS